MPAAVLREINRSFSIVNKYFIGKLLDLFYTELKFLLVRDQLENA